MKKPYAATLLMALFVGWALISAPLQAASNSSFFVELMTGDESRQSQDAAFAEGMRVILARLSGSDGFWLRSEFAGLVAKAPRYIRKFNYRQIPGDSRRKKIRLWYQPRKLRSALQSRGFTLPGDSPDTLLWLLEQHGGESWLIVPDEPDSLYEGLPALARSRGIQLMLPLVDLQERAAFNGTLPLDETNANLVSLSQRYDPGALLIGRLSAEGGGWRLDWTRIQSGRESFWSNQGGSIRSLLEQGLVRLAGGSGGIGRGNGQAAAKRLELSIGGMRGQRDVTRVRRYLEGLSMIDGVRSKGRQGDWTRLQVGLMGDRRTLKQAIGFGGLLRSVAAPQPKKRSRPRPSAFDPLDDFGGSGYSGSYKKKKSKRPPAPPSVLYFRAIR